MLTGTKVVFLGGDARMLEVVRFVSDLDASVSLCGFEQALIDSPDTSKVPLSPDVLRSADAVVLPVAGMNDDGVVEAKFADGHLLLQDEHFAAVPKAAMIFTGIARMGLSTATRKHGLTLVKLMELDEVAILNSIPTAEGAIALAMEHTDITLHGSHCVVLGMGRCGVTLARTLQGMGAKVSVCARKTADLARIAEMGLQPFPQSSIQEAISTADVIFNTVPAGILTADVLAHVHRSCVIIDIASAPGGTDFRYAEKRGIKAILAPSLPGIVAPKTAGRIIARTIARMLSEQA